MDGIKFENNLKLKSFAILKFEKFRDAL
jgi:hypothetical protein